MAAVGTADEQLAQLVEFFSAIKLETTSETATKLSTTTSDD
jgi:hypothetical protein